jgi:hypothetical protein
MAHSFWWQDGGMVKSVARAKAKAGSKSGAGATSRSKAGPGSGPASPAAYIAALPEPRRTEITRIDAFIRATVPDLAPCLTAGMLGYGPFHYRYASGREGDTAKIGLSSRAQYIALYACAADARGYVAERYAARLPAADIGKSCVRFKRLDDLDRAALRDLLLETARTEYGV